MELDTNKAFQLHQELVKLKQSLGLHFLYLGKLLSLSKENNYWKVIEPDLSWEAYCAMPEIGLSPSHVRNLIRTYEKLVNELGIEEEELTGIDQRKLTALVPRINESNKDELLAEAKTLTRRDFMINLKTKEIGEEHEHNWIVYSYEKCSLCYEEKNHKKG